MAYNVSVYTAHIVCIIHTRYKRAMDIGVCFESTGLRCRKRLKSQVVHERLLFVLIINRNSFDLHNIGMTAFSAAAGPPQRRKDLDRVRVFARDGVA